MKNIRKMSQSALMLISALAFVTMISGPSIGAEVMKIKPKGDKKITIGVLDLNAAIEIAALFNKEHKAAAEKRGWGIQISDLKDNIPQGPTYMENMISAGFDGIILHWCVLKTIDKQLKIAFDKGIPVITMANLGARFPGVLAEVGPQEATMAATSAEYLAAKLQTGDKVLFLDMPMIEQGQVRVTGAKGIFQAYNIKVAQELQFQASGDPFQWSYEQTKNTLLGDTKKELKGIWTSWEGFGISAARAAHDLGRDDIVVVTCDDSPNTYSEIRKLPTFHATTGYANQSKDLNEQVFAILEKVFKGEPVESQRFYPFIARLVTKDNLPPKGYFINPCGSYKGRPDFEVK